MTKRIGTNSHDAFSVLPSILCCERRIREAEMMGWPALAESWRKTLREVERAQKREKDDCDKLEPIW